MKYVELERALSSHLRIESTNFRQIVRTAPYSYKHYQIDKRNGGKRDIFHPTPELKAVQRWLIAEIFERLAVSASATAYEKGSSIREHAGLHRKSNYFTKLDFSDFFPSIHIEWVANFLRRGLPDFDEEAIRAISRLTCRSAGKQAPLALSIGAPSSPSLSNRILFDLDTALIAAAEASSVIYSRYADDIYFSSARSHILQDFERVVRRIIFEVTPTLRLNERKTLHTSRKRKVLISGVGITPDRKLSIGRSLKRSLRTQMFLWSSGVLSPEAAPRLRGLVSFASDVEPEFLMSLSQKFGRDLVSRLLAGNHPPDKGGGTKADNKGDDNKGDDNKGDDNKGQQRGSKGDGGS